jgi:TPR repeat protein
MKRVLGIIVVALAIIIVVPSTNSSAGEKSVVAVFDVESLGAGLSPRALDTLSDYVGSLMAERGYQVVPRSQIRKRLLGEKKNSYRNCYDESCQIELGKELAAEKSLSTQILRLGKGCKVTMVFYDLKKTATEQAATVSGGCSEDSLVRSIEQAVSRLAGDGAFSGERIAVWPPACSQARDCLERTLELVGQRKPEEAFVCAMAAEMRAQKDGDWKIAAEGRALQAKISMISMPNKGQMKDDLAEACQERQMEACMAFCRYLMLIEYDRDTSVQILQTMCKRGEQAACEDLGDAYAEGHGVARDKARAAGIRRKACKRGHLFACKDLGLMHISGAGMKRSAPRAAGYFKKACKGGEPEACDLLGALYGQGLVKGKKLADANKAFRKSCEGGWMEGCLHLGVAYASGDGVVKDERKAARLFFKACESGVPDGCTWMGKMLEAGERVNDERVRGMARKRVVKHYRKACDRGSIEGCYLLGKRYLTGAGVPREPETARSLFKKACNYGIEQACEIHKNGGAEYVYEVPERVSSDDEEPVSSNSKADGSDAPESLRLTGSVAPQMPEKSSWWKVSLWSGVGFLTVGAVGAGLGYSFAQDYKHDGSNLNLSRTFSGIMWAGLTTGTTLLITGLILRASESTDGQTSTTVASAAPTLEGNGLVVTVGGRW